MCIRDSVWDYRGNSRLPSFNYGTVDVTDLNGWTLAEIRLRPQQVENTYDSGQLDFAWSLSPNFTLKGGVQAKEYEFSSREWRRASETSIPSLTQAQRNELNKLVGLAGINVSGNPSRWVVPDVDAYNQLLDIYSNSGIYAVSDKIPGVAGNNRSVTETVSYTHLDVYKRQPRLLRQGSRQPHLRRGDKGRRRPRRPGKAGPAAPVVPGCQSCPVGRSL